MYCYQERYGPRTVRADSTCNLVRESWKLGGIKPSMNIGLFGGTFDPVHRGHIAVARAAMECCKLHKILFAVANVPPHKQRQPHTAFRTGLR